MNVTVVGIGAMGGGIARSLLRSSSTATVTGYDRSEPLVSAFHSEATSASKSSNSTTSHPATTLGQAVTSSTDAVVLVLVNEAQCQRVCFGSGGDNDDSNLMNLLSPGSVVILCSTVTSTWAQRAKDVFSERGGVLFVDCPISGGSARAQSGELTLMASGTDEALTAAKPLLEAVGTQIHTIEGGAGMGQTVKMAHQLLAGVHIVAAAEALALAAKAGIDVRQMYDIVSGAAGNSWMFGDRGSRMIGTEQPPQIKSALPIIIKDMDIVYKSAKDLGCPIPLASSALQQLLTASGMGLDRMDDSQVVKVYELITGVPVGKRESRKDATDEDIDDDDDDNGTPHLQCEIGGLEGRAGKTWNGRKGHVVEHLEDEDRFTVVVEDSAQRLKVRRENIKLLGNVNNDAAAAASSAISDSPVASPPNVPLPERLPKIKREPINCTVIGIGNIGGGMARALLKSPCTGTVTGYDRATDLVAAFHREAAASDKAALSKSPPSDMKEAVTKDVNVVVLTLVNERQCEAVCFGGNDGDNLLSLMSPGSCVILSSTVSAQWARYASRKFDSLDVHFVDSPVSGGAARAQTGELTMMASGDDMSLAVAMPVLEAAGKEVHLIEGGAGMGQTVKYVHQLLAGVHIVAAAECLALATKAGVDPRQMYEVVCGAAGTSWMFADRGKRMIQDGGPKVMSMVDIFVKDLGIVYSGAMGLKSPIPLASVALQQFVNASAMGLGKKDDSQVIMVYAKYLGYV